MASVSTNAEIDNDLSALNAIIQDSGDEIYAYTYTNIWHSLGNTTVGILVGENEKQENFTVHESLLRCRSQYFNACLDGNWAESDDRIVRLAKDEAEIFSLYVQTLYVGHARQPKRIEDEPSHWVKLSKLFEFCDMRMDGKGKQIVISALKAAVKEFPGVPVRSHFTDLATVINIMFELTKTGNPIRKKLISVILGEIKGWCEGEKHTTLVQELFANAPQSFLAEYAMEITKQHVSREKVPARARRW